VTEPDSRYQQHIARNYWWNFWASAIDGGSFSFLLSLLSPVVVLPYYVGQYTDSDLLLGAVYMLYALGRFLPQTLAANLIKHRARKKPFMIKMALLERVGLILMLLNTLIPPSLGSCWILLMFFGGYALLTFSLGFMSPAWLDFLAKAIYKRRGIFFGVLNTTGGILGIFGGIALRAVMARYSFPRNFTVAFGIAFVASLFSLAALLSYREVPSPFITARTSLLQHLRSLPSLLRRDSNFRHFISSRAVVGFADMALPFYAVYATRRIGDSAVQVANFNLTLMICQAMSTLLWGYLGDRKGYRLIYRLVTVTGFATAGLSLVVSSLGGYLLVFTLLGITLGGVLIADTNMVLEISPREQTPTYVGLMNTMVGPVMGLAPIVGGLLASRWGYSSVFIVAMAAQALGWVGMSILVKDPRCSQRSETSILRE